MACLDPQSDDEVDEEEVISSGDEKSTLTQLSPKREKLMIRPVDIDFPDLLKWVENMSNYSTGPPFTMVRDSPVYFDSQEAPDLPQREFLALSSTPGILALAVKRTEEARRLDASSTLVLGRLPPPKSCRVNTRLYQLSDNGISTESLVWPVGKPNFLLRVESNSRMYVMDKDLATMEATSRDTRAIMSNLDAFTSAVQTALGNLGITDPFIRRALTVMGSGTANTSRLMVSH